MEPQTSHGLTCEGDVGYAPGAQDYFENLRKRFRFDDDGKGGARLLDQGQTAAGSSNAQTRRPFQGLIVYIHKKIEEHRNELHRAVESLGGEIRYQHCQEVTHYVFQGKVPATAKEVKQAKEWLQKFVSPQWILDSDDAGTRMEESQYPPSLNPNMALSLNFSQQPSQAASAAVIQKRRHAGETPKTQRKRRADEDESEGLVNTEVRRLELQGDGANETEVEDENAKMELFEELLQVNEVISRSTEQLIPVIRKAPAVRLEAGPVFIPATQALVEAPESQTQVAWDLQNEKPAPSSYRVILSGNFSLV